MLDTQAFGLALKALGYDFYSGVPCSFLKDLINYAINDCEYIGAANEGDAVAIASGAKLGGRKAVVLMQNSGLTNATSPLTSLNFCFQLPVLGFVSWRGQPEVQDEPQHELMGQITHSMLGLMDVKHQVLAQDLQTAEQQLKQADNWINQGKTFFFIVKKGTFLQESLRSTQHKPANQPECFFSNAAEQQPSRLEALKSIQQVAGTKSVLLATTGKTGRELYEIQDNENQLYMVGSMGCISSLGLGLAVAKPKVPVIVVDGDGSLLMRLGALATNAFYQPKNLLHILLDNQIHDSTGGQATVSNYCGLAKMAEAAGYPQVSKVHSLAELTARIQRWQQQPQLSFIHVKIASGSKADLGRPTITPQEVQQRLSDFLARA